MLVVVGVVLLVAIGAYWLGSSRGSQVAPPMPGAPTAGLPPGAGPPPGMAQGPLPQVGTPPGAAPDFQTQQRIAIAEQLVKKEPKNVQAWIQLGNDYFDTHQAQKSVDAYSKALALKPNDPDVLTDQGVMYRELHAYDKAVANFEKANQVDPRHVQSLYNLGVVWAYDLRDNQKAARYWGRVIELAPGSPQAVQARQNLASLPAP
jgi:cytochrome c-type biogenesis protein CcmH/NrfG